MLLALTNRSNTATDLGYLLHKNPTNLFEKEMWFGRARVFYPEADSAVCTAALLLEVDPVGLVRGKGASLDQYVNDRPYVASSLLSVAMGEVYSTAIAGRCNAKPELVDTKLDLSATIAAVDCDGGDAMIRRLFEPLGYTVETNRAPLDQRFPEWGESDIYSVVISGHQTVQALLTHLYVLIPVLDNAKHYFVGEDEVEKLLRKGEGWLPAHPEKELIARRYLKYRHNMVRAALEQMRDDAVPADDDTAEAEEEKIEQPVRLNDQRMDAALDAVKATPGGAKRILDLGCGEGKLLKMLLNERGLDQITGVDVSTMVLEKAERKLGLERLPERKRQKVQLIQGSLVYRDARFEGFDCATLIEVIEHLDPPRLAALEQVVFRHAKPRRVIVSTPNAEYNSVWESLPAGKFRHRDHRFEWTREQFAMWAERVAGTFGYTAEIQPIGPVDPERGSPTQMATFDQA